MSRCDEPHDCKKCGAVEGSHPIISATHYAGERIVGDRKIIWDEKQVVSDKGENWRDEGTTGNPGGAGKRLYFHD